MMVGIMEIVARQLSNELEKLVELYHRESNEQRQVIIKQGCEYRLGKLWCEGNPELAIEWRDKIHALNGHPHYQGDE
jgi:hypothetical protein